MSKFEVGGYVQSDDFVIGQIVELHEDWCYVEFETYGGGGCDTYALSELTPVDIQAFRASELLRDWTNLVYKTKEYGMDIRFAPDCLETLELYYHEDYPNMLLVDKSISRYEQRTFCPNDGC